MTESINEIERARAKARMLTGKTLDPVPTLAQGTKGKSREKVSKKIGMKPRINTFADRIVLTESVKLIKD